MTVTATTIFTGFDQVLNKLNLIDTTDYAAQGVDFNAGDTVAGYFKTEYDLGSGWVVFYNNIGGGTPDTTPPSAVNLATIDLPLDTNGNPLKATYRVTYYIIVTSVATDPALVYNVTTEFTYTYTFVKPEICIDTAVDCSASKITSEDVTVYDVAGTTTESVARAHTLYPPPTSGLNDLTADVVTLVYIPITSSGTWTAEVISNVVYSQPDGLNIVVQLTGVKETVVSCSTKLSKVLCCLTTIYNTYQNYLTKNSTKAENYKEMTMRPTWDAVVLFLSAQSSGNANKMAYAYAQVLEFSGCGDCSCNDEITVLQPESTGGTGFAYQVDSPGATVDVTQTVAGNVITFHLEVSASILNIINNIQNLVSVAGDGTYITVIQSGTSPVTYTVTYTGPVIHTNQLVQKEIVINPYDVLSLNPNYLVMTVNEIYNAGANVAAAPHTYLLGLNSPNGTSDLAIIKVQNFMTDVTPKKFIVNASLNRTHTIPVTAYMAPANMRLEVFHKDINSQLGLVLLRVLDSMNNPMTLLQLNSLMAGSPLYISLDIIIEP